MPVHASSVIPTWINTFNPTFYTAFTNQENDAYVRDINWRTVFLSLVSPLTTYKNVSITVAVRHFIPLLYGYRIMNVGYGTSGSLLTSSDARTVFYINGFVPDCIGRAVGYYDDLSFDPDGGFYSSTKINTDANTINVANDNSSVNAQGALIQTQMELTSQVFLFETVPPIAPIPDKPTMATYIFITLHWKGIYQTLNVSPLALPPGV